jgi:hypothetical protein
MIGYPTNRLLAVIDEPADAAAAADDLRGGDGARPDIVVLTGADGVEGLHRLGGAPGLLARFVRMFQFMSMDQTPDFLKYEAAIRDGRAVVAVRPATRDAMLADRDRLIARGAHFANWFGRLSTEEFTPWRGPEPDIPGYLRR